MKSSLVIDCNQQQCIYFEPRGENGERLAPREKPHLPDDDGRYYKAIHQYPDIPKTIQKKWRYLHKYSQIIKSKTVKVKKQDLDHNLLIFQKKNRKNVKILDSDFH